jgi:hypothetical protein
MLNRWWCMDCRSAVDLNRHGRCASCESEAVDSCHRRPCDVSTAPAGDMSITDAVSFA